MAAVFDILFFFFKKRYNYYVYAIAILVALVIAFFIYQYWKYRAADDGAPYVAMEREVVDHILKLASIQKNDILYDLGSGDGRIPIMASLRYGIRSVGVEIDKFRYYYSLYQRLITGLKDKVTFYKKNIFDVDLSQATVVIIYLEQHTNEALADKLLKELKPGTLVISPSWNFPDWRPILVDDDHALTTPWGPTSFYEIGRSTDVQVRLAVQTQPAITPPSANPQT